MDTQIIKAALDTIVAPSPNSATARSSEPTKSLPELNANTENDRKIHPATTRFPGLAESEEFRRRILKLDETHHPMVRRMARHGESWLRRCLNNDRTRGLQLVISGPAGCGKTHVAERVYGCFRSWAVDAMFTPGWNGAFPWSRFIDWSEIADSDKQATYEYESDCARRSKVIVIDDVGSESDRFKSGGPAARLRHLLSMCDSKWLLLTTNLTEPEFGRRYDARVLDRLSSAHWCDCSKVPSYRPKLRGVAV